jgi:hypothetical protein
MYKRQLDGLIMRCPQVALRHFLTNACRGHRCYRNSIRYTNLIVLSCQVLTNTAPSVPRTLPHDSPGLTRGEPAFSIKLVTDMIFCSLDLTSSQPDAEPGSAAVWRSDSADSYIIDKFCLHALTNLRYACCLDRGVSNE